MKTILITGGNGFIGKHLVSHFRAKPDEYKVLAPSRQELDLTRKDDVDKYLINNPIDLVIHGADVKKDFEQNMRMFWNLRFAKIVLLGSWDDRNDTPHGLYKQIATEYTAFFSYRMATLRLFGVIGEGDTTSRFIPTIMKQSKAGEPITVTEDHLMEYSDVKDVCEAVEELVTGAIPLNVYDLLSGKPEMLSNIGKYVSELGGNRSKMVVLKSHMEEGFPPTPGSKSISVKNPIPMYETLRRVYNSL